MSAIIGFLGSDGRPAKAEDLKRMVEILAHRGPDGRAIWCEGSVGLGHCMLHTTPESLNEHLPFERDGLVITADARIDNREELIAVLALNKGSITDAQLILTAYQKWGEECVVKLVGDFSFAIWNQKSHECFCARDTAGVKSFYYYHCDHLFAFATEIKALLEIPEVPHELHEERIADYLISIFDDQSSTFFRGIFRLPAGHCITINTHGLRMRRYWALNPDYELALKSDGEYEEAFRELFTKSVHCRLRSAFPVGTTLSGGLDSSSIACTARDYFKNKSRGQLHTFSAVFPSLPEADLRRIDERSYMNEVLVGGGFIAHEVRADELSPLGDLENILWHQDDPLVPFNLYIHLGIYRAACTHGVRVVLDGFDGDTTVSHGYERFAELAKQFHWFTLLREARALSQRFGTRYLPLWKVLWSYAFSPLQPGALSEFWKRLRGQPSSLWSSDFVISESFAGKVKLAERVRHLQIKNAGSFGGVRQTHLQGLEYPLIPYALELADKTAGACSLEPRYPFFDRRLVEFCLAVPADQRLREGWPRSLQRRAMQGILPPKVQWRKSKADLSPNFCRNLLMLDRNTLERVLEKEAKAIDEFVNVMALSRLYQRYTCSPSNADAMKLFMAVTFAAWMGQRAVFRNNQPL